MITTLVAFFDEEGDFVAFLKDDMVIEMIVLYYAIIR